MNRYHFFHKFNIFCLFYWYTIMHPRNCMLRVTQPICIYLSQNSLPYVSSIRRPTVCYNLPNVHLLPLSIPLHNGQEMVARGGTKHLSNLPPTKNICSRNFIIDTCRGTNLWGNIHRNHCLRELNVLEVSVLYVCWIYEYTSWMFDFLRTWWLHDYFNPGPIFDRHIPYNNFKQSGAPALQ